MAGMARSRSMHESMATSHKPELVNYKFLRSAVDIKWVSLHATFPYD